MYKASSNHQISLRCQFYKERCTKICNDRYQSCDRCHDLNQHSVLYNIRKVINNRTCLNYIATEEPYDIQCKQFPRFIVKQAGNVCFQTDFFLFDHNTFFCVKEAEKENKASNDSKDHHYNTETKCFIAISEFINKCQGKCTDYSRTYRGEESSAGCKDCSFMRIFTQRRKDRCHRDIYNSVCCRKQNVRYICVDQHSCLSDIRDRKSNNRCHTKRNCTKQNPWS